MESVDLRKFATTCFKEQLTCELLCDTMQCSYSSFCEGNLGEFYICDSKTPNGLAVTIIIGITIIAILSLIFLIASLYCFCKKRLLSKFLNRYDEQGDDKEAIVSSSDTTSKKVLATKSNPIVYTTSSKFTPSPKIKHIHSFPNLDTVAEIDSFTKSPARKTFKL
uniref:Uncharacterized protein n=1 Tax=Rhabditophanes sp. KR3021 TaxID=114890 RepID=A0AC35UDV9_9BILA